MEEWKNSPIKVGDAKKKKRTTTEAFTSTTLGREKHQERNLFRITNRRSSHEKYAQTHYGKEAFKSQSNV